MTLLNQCIHLSVIDFTFWCDILFSLVFYFLFQFLINCCHFCRRNFCTGSRGRKRELITISDDSDEEFVNLVPRSPVLVPDDADDDDIAILEVTVRLFFELRPLKMPSRLVGFKSAV